MLELKFCLQLDSLVHTMNFRLQLTFIKNYLTTQIALNFHQQVNTFD